jgi:hypothetical protein
MRHSSYSPLWRPQNWLMLRCLVSKRQGKRWRIFQRGSIIIPPICNIWPLIWKSEPFEFNTIRNVELIDWGIVWAVIYTLSTRHWKGCTRYSKRLKSLIVTPDQLITRIMWFLKEMHELSSPVWRCLSYVGMILINESGAIWVEDVMCYINFRSRHLIGTKENRRVPQSG